MRDSSLGSAADFAVHMRGVAFRHGPTQVLTGLDLDIERDKVTVLLGPNGAGKTTTIRLMLGLLKPAEGEVRLFGADPARREARRRVGVMMQVAKVPETLRVREHIDIFRSYYPHPLSQAALIDLAGLGGLEGRLFGQLSGGEQQRVLFALALAGDPDLLFLDEPTVGMDVETRRAFWGQIRALRDQGRSILLTTHYLEEADALADRVVVLNSGRIVADGSPAQIKQHTRGRRITCRSRLTEAAVCAIPAVETASRDGDTLTVTTDRLEAVLRILLDPTLSDLEITGAALEDAFVAVTANAPEPVQ
jgi:ABC-2 type transport system ATP-binding protein